MKSCSPVFVQTKINTNAVCNNSVIYITAQIYLFTVIGQTENLQKNLKYWKAQGFWLLEKDNDISGIRSRFQDHAGKIFVIFLCLFKAGNPGRGKPPSYPMVFDKLK